MNCEEFNNKLDNYENLTEEEKNELNEHAKGCDKCGEELTFFLSMISATKSLPEIEVPEDFMLKLNDRLDIEDKKAASITIISRFKKNWVQYTSIAASIALVAVITANRGILLNRIRGAENGVVTEDNNGKGDDTGSDNSVVPIEPMGEVAQIGETKTEDNEITTAVIASASKSNPAPKTSTTSSGGSKGASWRGKESDTVSDRVSETESIIESNNDSYSESKTDSNMSSDDYAIALAGVINAETATANVNYDMKPAEVSASLRANKVMEDYSLSSNEGGMIAYGRYYSIDQNGRPIMEQKGKAATAVGSIKISSSDEKTVKNVLKQYPHDKKDDVYTTGSENVNQILTDLSDEGVKYTDYLVGGSDDVKFKVEVDD